MTFDLADRLRHGSDLAGTEEIAYLLCGIGRETGKRIGWP
jgi:hypothetical protein